MLHEQGGAALKQGKVDAWAVSSDRYRNVLETQDLSAKDFTVIYKSNLLPSDVFVASNQLATDFVTKLISIMLTAKAN